MASAAEGLLILPDEVLEKILSFASFEEISHLRIVCRSFACACARLLNHGFVRVERLHSVIQKEVKAKLPRRESERRSHALARHVDILAAIETRLSLLNMTFVKYIDSHLCCFIPGKVLDELLRVLYFVRHTVKPARAHELLQELRDISSMAMEHFDEQIVPGLRSHAYGGSSGEIRRIATLTSLYRDDDGNEYKQQALPSSGAPPQHGLVAVSMLAIRKELVICKLRISSQQKEALEQAKVMGELHKQKGERDQQMNELSVTLQKCERRCVSLEASVARLCRLVGMEHDGDTSAAGAMSQPPEDKRRRSLRKRRAACSKQLLCKTTKL